MSSYRDVLNYPEAWHPDMPRPLDFNPDAVARFQKEIDQITGTRNGKPIVWLRWGPEVKKWRPWPFSDQENAEGYTFPVFLALWINNQEVSAPRWVLMERWEPEQYMDSWEEGRYVTIDGILYDAKGPPPEDYYVPLWRHIVHEADRSCCHAHDGDCWGLYVEPNEDLLGRIRRSAFMARNDTDIKPFLPSQQFSSPKAQAEAKEHLITEAKKQEELIDQVLIDAERRRLARRAYSI